MPPMRCVECGAKRHETDMAGYARPDGWTANLCHGAFDPSPTCYERFSSFQAARQRVVGTVPEVESPNGLFVAFAILVLIIVITAAALA